jgi:hypothetical protein
MLKGGRRRLRVERRRIIIETAVEEGGGFERLAAHGVRHSDANPRLPGEEHIAGLFGAITDRAPELFRVTLAVLEMLEGPLVCGEPAGKIQLTCRAGVFDGR